MTHDEFLYEQLKSSVTLYRGIALVYAACVVACLVMGVVAVVLGGNWIALASGICMGVGFAASAMGARSQSNAYVEAVREVGENPAGLDDCSVYSKRTASLVTQMQNDVKHFLGQAIAYGVIGVMALAGAGVIWFVSEDSWVFVVLSGFLAAVGLVLCVLAFKAFHNWRVFKRFEEC